MTYFTPPTFHKTECVCVYVKLYSKNIFKFRHQGYTFWNMKGWNLFEVANADFGHFWAFLGIFIICATTLSQQLLVRITASHGTYTSHLYILELLYWLIIYFSVILPTVILHLCLLGLHYYVCEEKPRVGRELKGKWNASKTLCVYSLKYKVTDCNQWWGTA